MQGSELLLAGEKLLWKGAPAPGLKFRPRDIFFTVFGAFFFGFSIFWMYMTRQMEAPIYFTLFGTPFVIVGAYLFVGRFFWEAYRRGQTSYVLTDRRALIRVDSFGRSQKAVSLDDVDEIALEERSDGLGTIVFGRDITTGSGDNQSTSYAPRFEYIKDAGRIYQMAENARNKA